MKAKTTQEDRFLDYVFRCTCGETKRASLLSTHHDYRKARAWAYRHAAKGHRVVADVTHHFCIEPTEDP